MERQLIVAYLRHMATLRPADANGLRVIASDVEAAFHLDPELNPAAAHPQPIIPTPTATHERHTGVSVKLGCMDVQMPRGLIHVHDAPGITSTELLVNGQFTSIGLLIYDDDHKASTMGDRGFGMINQLDAAAARSFAASLMRMATKLDGGKGMQ